jgi:LPS-assembly protein
MKAPAFSFSGRKKLLVLFGICTGLRPILASAQDVPVPDMPMQDSVNSAMPEAPPIPPASEKRQENRDEKIEFSAEKLDYDSNADVVTAIGDVILNRDGYRLRADTVVWNRKTGEVTAQGNIRSVGPRGDVAYGDSITLTDTLRDGMIQNLLLIMADGGRLAAKEGSRTNGRLELNYANYSPCSVEKPDGCPKEPSWQVKAVQVTYDPVKKRVKYKGARIELFGLPVIPLPGLSHPAESKAGSGFLVPDLRLTRNNGVEIEVPYYLRIAPNRDLLASATLFSKVAPLFKGQFRTFEKTGAFQILALGTFSEAVSTEPGITSTNTKLRGYIDASGKFQLNPNWSVTASLRRASDRTFLRRYDISRDDRLRSTVNIERIDSKSYFSLAGWAVQTLRVGDRQGLTPIALPEIDYRLRLDNPVLGGRVQFQANSLAIGRTDGQNTQRAFASARWDLRKITPLGQEVNFTVFGRGDLYHSNNNESTVTEIYRGLPGFQTRGIIAAAADVRWPFVGDLFGGTQTLTPRVQFVAAPTTANLKIPNEDSRAVDLEDSNLFALSRISGYDRFDDSSRVTYGLDWALRGANFTIDANIGQSYRLSNRQSIFPQGTGLSENQSDIVGRTDIRFRDYIKITHRYRLDKDTLAIRRNELDATVGTRGTYGQIGYLRLNRNVSANIEDFKDREEIRLAGRVTIARHWSIFGSTIIDLTDRTDDPFSISDGFDPIRHRLGIAYDDDCLSLGFSWKRDYQPTGDARRGNSFLFRVAFRNLGV